MINFEVKAKDLITQMHSSGFKEAREFNGMIIKALHAAYAEGQRDEREACAKVAESHVAVGQKPSKIISQAIRNRSNQ